MGGNGFPTTTTTTAAHNAVQIDDGVADLAAGAGNAAVHGSVDDESDSDRFATIDRGEGRDASPGTEPPITERLDPGVMIKVDGKPEARRQDRAEFEAGESRSKVHLDDPALIGVHDSTHRDTDTEDRPTVGG